MERTIYSDFDVQFNVHPITKDIIKKTNEQSVRQSLKLLLQTVFYDRKWQPEIGCNLNDILFGQLDAFQLYTTQEKIKNVIQNYEPRIELYDVSCTVDERNEFRVNIKLVYKILMLDKTDTFVYAINKIR